MLITYLHQLKSRNVTYVTLIASLMQRVWHLPTERKTIQFRVFHINLITQDELGNTALSVACQNGHVNIIRHLVKRGADVDFQHRVSN